MHDTNDQEISSKTSSNRVLTRGLFPHNSTIIALEECDARILTTDGSYGRQKVSGGGKKDQKNAH